MRYLTPAILSAGCSFFVTRGLDGDLLVCFFLFGFLGLAYWSYLQSSRNRPSFLSRLGIFFISLASAILGYSIAPTLDSMAGMLYLFIPMIIFGAFLIGEIRLLILRLLPSKTTPGSLDNKSDSEESYR